MASSGNITGTTGNANLTFIIRWNIAGTDPATRSSKVRFRWVMRRSTTATTTFKDNAAWTQKVDGQSLNGTLDFDIRNTAANTDYVFLTKNVWIQHDPDGTKTASVKCTLDLTGTSAGTCTASGQIVLDAIHVEPPTATFDSITDSTLTYSNLGGVYVAGFSKLALTASATEGEGAIASYSFYRDTTLMGTVTTSALTATLTMTTAEPSGTYTYSVIVTDEYGLTATAIYASTLTIEPYTMPTISSVSTFRCNSGGSADNEGTHGSCGMSWSVAAVGTNAATVARVVINGNTENFLDPDTTNPVIVGGLSLDYSYSAVYTVTDKLGSTATITGQVQVSYINFSLFPSSVGGGAAFGEKAQNNKLIVNHGETILRGDLTKDDKAGGNLTIKQMGTNRTNYDAFALPATGAISNNGSYEIFTTKNASMTPTDHWSGTFTSDFSNCKCFSGYSGGSQIEIDWYQFGRMVFAVFKVSRAASTAAGSSVYIANIRNDSTYGNYLPLVTACSAGYNGSSGVIAKYDTNGTFTCRVIGATLATNTVVQVGMTIMLA